MPLPLLALAAPAILSTGYKFFAGNKQNRKGEEMARNNIRSTYERPPEVDQALQLAERNYRNGMPGSNQLRNDINASAAAAFNSAEQGASSSADVLDAATKINYSSNIANNNLAIQEMDYKQDALRGYTGQLNNNAMYTDKSFSYNEDQPYQQRAVAASALIGVGEQNKFLGIDEIGGLATNALMSGGLDRPPATGNPIVQQLPTDKVIDASLSPNPANALTMGGKYGIPLLAHRAAFLKQLLFQVIESKVPTQLEKLIEGHTQDLELHLSRMYRIRNTIIHNAAINMDIISTTSNLRYYLTFTIVTLIKELTDNTSLQCIEDVFITQETQFNSLKEEKFKKEKLLSVPTNFDFII